MKFVKKPVIIEAIRWDGKNKAEIEAFTGDAHFWFNGPDENPPKLGIKTLEGKLLAAEGDWIIKGVKGEFYPCKPDIFAATYTGTESLDPGPLSKEGAIAACKTFRRDADELLQRMKSHRKRLTDPNLPKDSTDDLGEVIAQHTLSTRDLESVIMRQGMALKYIGAPDPYPQSKNPESTVVEPTADGLKL